MDSSKKIFTILVSLLFWVPLKSDPQIKNSAFVSSSSVFGKFGLWGERFRHFVSYLTKILAADNFNNYRL